MTPEACRVLVVEDSSSMRAFVRAALEGAAMKVVEAGSGFEALRLLSRDRFDVVIVDLNLPSITGLELVSLLRRSPEHGATPILIISTAVAERDRARGLELGANGFLSKPFRPEQLEAAVRALVTGD